MQQTDQIKTSLKREYLLYSNAMAFYKKALEEFEKKYQLATKTFLKRFEAGEMGDEADYFDWYAFAKLLAQWRKTKSAIRQCLRSIERDPFYLLEFRRKPFIKSLRINSTRTY